MNDEANAAENNTSADDVDSKDNEATGNNAADDFYPDEKNEGDAADQDDQKADDADEDAADDAEDGEEDGEEEDQDADEDVTPYDEFTTPEGIEIDQDALAKATPLLRKLNASQEDAQGLVDVVSDLIKGQVETAREEGVNYWDQQRKTWRDEITADKEYGGDKLKENLHYADKFLDAFGDKESVKEALELTGVGDHPALIKLFIKAGKHFGEGKAVTTGNKAGGETSAADDFYGDFKV